MVFILLYFPCVATLIAIAKETGRWYWAAVTVLYNTAVAWVVAYIVYLIGGLF
jgi:ferrous iron transport protein B